MLVLGGYKLHRVQLPAASALQLTQKQVGGIFQAKCHDCLCPPFLRCVSPRNGCLGAFHPQPGGHSITPGLSVLALSIPLGRGTAQRGAGPERLTDELSSPRLSPRKTCLMQFLSRDPVWTDSQHVPKGDPMAVPEPDATAAPRHPAQPRGICAPTRYVCTEPGEQVLTSPAALAATHTRLGSSFFHLAQLAKSCHPWRCCQRLPGGPTTSPNASQPL